MSWCVGTRSATNHTTWPDVVPTLVAGEGHKISAQAQHARLRQIAKKPVLTATPADPDDLRELSAEQLVKMRKLLL